MQKAFIETQFPIARLSAESYKERMAGASQTLTRLGNWQGRKPLILVPVCILEMLMPASNDPKKDRGIFLKILTMDDDGTQQPRMASEGDRASDELTRPDCHDAVWRTSSDDLKRCDGDVIPLTQREARPAAAHRGRNPG